MGIPEQMGKDTRAETWDERTGAGREGGRCLERSEELDSRLGWGRGSSVRVVVTDAGKGDHGGCRRPGCRKTGRKNGHLASAPASFPHLLPPSHSWGTFTPKAAVCFRHLSFSKQTFHPPASSKVGWKVLGLKSSSGKRRGCRVFLLSCLGLLSSKLSRFEQDGDGDLVTVTWQN